VVTEISIYKSNDFIAVIIPVEILIASPIDAVIAFVIGDTGSIPIQKFM